MYMFMAFFSRKHLKLFATSGHFCRLLITFAFSLDLDQTGPFVVPNLGLD